MSHRARSALAASASVVALLAAPSVARPQDQDQAAAEALFKAGRTLVQAGEIEAGCQKLEQSQEIAPSLGTLLNIADCRERTGRTATAWLHFRKAANMARIEGDNPREEMARRRAASLEPGLCMLSVGASQPAPQPDLVVTRDGASVGHKVLGVPTPVDPGVHRVRFTRGTRTEERHVEAKPSPEGGGCPPIGVALPAWAFEPAATPPVVAPAAAAPLAPVAEPPPSSGARDDRSVGFGAHHAIAIATFGAGAIVTGVGAGFGIDAIVTNADAEDHCTAQGCTARGLTDLEDAGASADVSTVLFAVGGGLLVTGVVLWITSPSLAVEPAPQGALLRF